MPGGQKECLRASLREGERQRIRHFWSEDALHTRWAGGNTGIRVARRSVKESISLLQAVLYVHFDTLCVCLAGARARVHIYSSIFSKICALRMFELYHYIPSV